MVTVGTLERPRRRTPTARTRHATATVVLSLALVCSIPLAVSVGAAHLAPGEVWSAILAHFTGLRAPLDPTLDAIVWELRLPRVLTAIGVGAGLALCGTVLQALTRNALADPYLLGLSSGASLGAVTVILLGAAITLPIAAFLGAMLALAASWLLAGRDSATTRIVLAGVAVSGFFSALTSFAIIWHADGESYRDVLGWILGSFAGSAWSSVATVAVALLVAGVPLITTGRTLDAFAFGDVTAASLGVDPARVRALMLLGTAVLTGALVSVSGAIGFVGLLVPHAVRVVVGATNQRILLLSALAGGTFLLWADTAARTIFAPREVPVGVLTALIGAPVFAVLLVRRRRSG